MPKKFYQKNSICDIKKTINFFTDINLLSNLIDFSLINKDISNLMDRILILLKFYNIIKEFTWTFHFFDKDNKNDLYYKINVKIKNIMYI